MTIACGPLAVSLFEGYPLLDQIIPLKKEKYSRHWLRLWRRVILRRWDIVIDLRNSAVSRLIFTRRRHIFGPQIDKSQHKVEQAAQLLGLSTVPAPKLLFSDVQ